MQKPAWTSALAMVTPMRPEALRGKALRELRAQKDAEMIGLRTKAERMEAQEQAWRAQVNRRV